LPDMHRTRDLQKALDFLHDIHSVKDGVETQS
jgi:ATP-dependent DNA helicase DinG